MKFNIDYDSQPEKFLAKLDKVPCNSSLPPNILDPITISDLPSCIGLTILGISFGSWEPSASNNIIISFLAAFIPILFAAPFPFPLSFITLTFNDLAIFYFINAIYL